MPGREILADVRRQRQEAVGRDHGELLTRAALAADPAVADGDRARQDRGDVRVVGDQQDGGAEVAVDLAHRGQHQVAGLVVELAGRLVGQQQPGAGGDRDRERRELEVARA